MTKEELLKVAPELLLFQQFQPNDDCPTYRRAAQFEQLDHLGRGRVLTLAHKHPPDTGEQLLQRRDPRTPE